MIFIIRKKVSNLNTFFMEVIIINLGKETSHFRCFIIKLP